MTIHPRKIAPFKITEDELSADAESCVHCATPIWEVDGYKLDGEGVCQTCRDIENDEEFAFEELMREPVEVECIECGNYSPYGTPCSHPPSEEEIREMEVETWRKEALDADFR